MRSARLAILFAAALSGFASAQATNGLAEAIFAPPDVSLFVHVRDASELRRTIADRPMREWVQSMLQGELGVSWDRLARDMRLESGELFDRYLGRRLSLVVRKPSGGASQWALWVEAGGADVERLQATLRPRLLGPRGGIPVADAADHGVLFAATADRLVIGPRAAGELFREVLDRMEVPGDRASLATAIRNGAEALVGDLRSNQALVLAHHEPPLGGWSAVGIELEGGVAHVQLSSRFDNSPLQRRMTATIWDASPLEQFEERTLLAIMEPTDVGDGLPERYLGAMLQQPLLSPALCRRLKSRRIITVGEEEGRRLERPLDMLSTTAALCLEVDDAEQCRAPLDALMLAAVGRIQELGQGAFLLKVDVPTPAANAPRQVDVSAATSWLTGGFPIMRNIHLAWQVTNGPHGAWCVIASHPGHLSEVIGALAVGPRSGPIPARLDCVGSANGARIGQHLRSWGEAGALFQRTDGPGTIAPEEERQVRAALEVLCDFAVGVDRVRWKLWRPSANQVRAEAQFILADGPSAGKAPEGP